MENTVVIAEIKNKRAAAAALLFCVSWGPSVLTIDGQCDVRAVVTPFQSLFQNSLYVFGRTGFPR